MVEKHGHVGGENSVAVDYVLNDEPEAIERVHSRIIKKGDDFGEDVFGFLV